MKFLLIGIALISVSLAAPVYPTLWQFQTALCQLAPIRDEPARVVQFRACDFGVTPYCDSSIAPQFVAPQANCKPWTDVHIDSPPAPTTVVGPADQTDTDFYLQHHVAANNTVSGPWVQVRLFIPNTGCTLLANVVWQKEGITRTSADWIGEVHDDYGRSYVVTIEGNQCISYGNDCSLLPRFRQDGTSRFGQQCVIWLNATLGVCTQFNVGTTAAYDAIVDRVVIP